MEVDIMEGRELNTVIARCIGFHETPNFVGDIREINHLWHIMESQGWRVTVRGCSFGGHLDDAQVWLEKPRRMVTATGPTWLVAFGRAVVKAESGQTGGLHE